MQRFGKTGFVILVLGLVWCGQANRVVAQSDAPKAVQSTVADATVKRHCRSLKMAAELADGLDLSDPLAAVLWSEIGKCEARSGDVDAVRLKLKLKEPVNAQALLIMAKAEMGVVLARLWPQRTDWKKPNRPFSKFQNSCLINAALLMRTPPESVRSRDTRRKPLDFGGWRNEPSPMNRTSRSVTSPN